MQVVTLFYRSIDRLLGLEKYSTALDMWSVGCIMAELLAGGETLFRAKGEITGDGTIATVKTIFNILGTPVEEGLPEDHPRYWKGWENELPSMQTLRFDNAPCRLREKFPPFTKLTSNWLSEEGYDLLLRMLAFNPQNRISAKEALTHAWFWEEPMPTRVEDMPAFPSKAAGEVAQGPTLLEQIARAEAAG